MIHRIKAGLRELSHKQAHANSAYRFASRAKTRLIAHLSDERFARWKYYESTGHRLNLENPVGFNEKLWWLKLNNRDPLLTTCSDKLLVREYLKDEGLEYILVPIFGVYADPTEVPWSKLPRRAFIKTNHGSGTNAFWDREQPHFDVKSFERRFKVALRRNYYLESREWNYKDIQPKVVIENVLECKNEAPLLDYRFLCFDGTVKLLFVDFDTAAVDGTHNPDAKRNVYTPDFEMTSITAKRERFPSELAPKPENFSAMVEIAEKIAAPFPFCRVDLYNVDGRIYFGEATFYPGGCTQLVDPPAWENRLGEWIDLQSEKIVQA